MYVGETVEKKVILKNPTAADAYWSILLCELPEEEGVLSADDLVWFEVGLIEHARSVFTQAVCERG